MTITYAQSDSALSSPSTPTHLRKRSSIAAGTSPSPPHFAFGSTVQPFITHGAYDERTGEIALPASPPLYSWSEKEKFGSLPYEDEKRGGRLPAYSWGAESRKASIRRPWLSLATAAGCTFAFVVLISYLSPEGSAMNQTILSRMPFGPASNCNPYTSPGALTTDPSEADRNQFIPFDTNCRAPSFLAKLRAEAPLHASSDFSWLQNKTVLLIGDSISREHVENFCTLMGLESEIVRKSHKYSPQPTAVRPAGKAGHAIEKPARLSSRGFRVVRDASLPRICYVPKYDFLLASVFHFGLDQEDYWRGSRMPQYSSPGMFEHRLSDTIQPLIANMRADGRPNAPDYVEVSSGTWDLARWAEQDMDEEKPTDEALAQDRVTWYRFRVGQMLEKIRKAFPNAKAKTWRTMHYPTDQVAEHDYFMDKINGRTDNTTDSPPPPSFSHNRILQLDQVVRSLVLPSTDLEGYAQPAPHSDFRLNEWGTLLKGNEAHQKDRLHGDPLPGGYLWSDIMLYELHHAVKVAGMAPMRSMEPVLY
ncbi:hypothetical protein P7C70_g5803, partial [Phenoliferia sp. Uapishka_3]